MTSRYNPPPHWPEPPSPDWQPPEGWQPGPGWRPAPAGWRHAWDADAEPPVPSVAVAPAETMTATTSAPVRAAAYPIVVSLPGVLEAAAVTQDTHGFPPPETRGPRGRRRAVTWIAALLGFLIAAATVVLFVWLYQYAMSSLPSQVPASLLTLPHASFGTGWYTAGG